MPKRSQKVVKQALERDDHICQECGSTEDLEVHHIVAISIGGRDRIDNVVTLCHECHIAANGFGSDFAFAVMADLLGCDDPLHAREHLAVCSDKRGQRGNRYVCGICGDDFTWNAIFTHENVCLNLEMDAIFDYYAECAGLRCDLTKLVRAGDRVSLPVHLFGQWFIGRWRP